MNTRKLTIIAAVAVTCFALSAQEQGEPNQQFPRTPAGPQQPPDGPSAPRKPQPATPPQRLEPPQNQLSPQRPHPPQAPEDGRSFGGGGGGSSGGVSFQDNLSRLARMAGDAMGGPSRSLVIASSMQEAETVAHLEEDLNVMSRILEKAMARSLGQSQDDRYMGIRIPGLSGGRSTQSLYLDGYGALFLLNVRFPLMDSTKPTAKTDKPTNSAWEQTKREIQGGGPSPSDGRAMEYSEDKVEFLKKEFMAELKNATNIRGLKPDDTITVAAISDRSGNAPDSRALDPTYQELPARPTTMTLRVKKSDVDAFAKGKMSLEDFQKTVTVTTY